MALDLRKACKIVQALLRAWIKKDEGDVIENVAKTSTASGGGSDGEPAPAGTRLSSPSQPCVTTGDEAANQSHKPVPTPRPRLFREQQDSPLLARLPTWRKFAAILRTISTLSPLAICRPAIAQAVSDIAPSVDTENPDLFEPTTNLPRSVVT